MLYFAYGSNMSVRRLVERVPSARVVGPAELPGHRLAFHKVGRDGSAKCDAHQTRNPDHRVHGVLFLLAAEDRPVLDRYEGLGQGYEQKQVEIIVDGGDIITAFTYYATHIDPVLKPFGWYKQHVVTGARENALPDDYVNLIEAVEHIDDHDTQRHHRELSIYL